MKNLFSLCLFLLYFVPGLFANQSYDLAGFGAGFMDFLVHVEEKFLDDLPGLKEGSDLVSAEEFDELVKKLGKTPYIATGGSCVNTIKSAASLGASCKLITQVGNDALGDQFSDYIGNIKNIDSTIQKSLLPTARILCLVAPSGERTMRITTNSSQDMSDFSLDGEMFKGVKIVHVEAYTFRDAYRSNDGRLVKYLLRLAKQAGAKVSLDLSSIEIVTKYKQEILDFLKEADFVFGNESEMRVLTGLEPIEASEKLQQICPVVVVLQGEKGCLVRSQGQTFKATAVPTAVIDTTGAGDLFAAGFLYSYSRGHSLQKCAENGNLLGSAIVAIEGTELPKAEWKRLNALINF